MFKICNCKSYRIKFCEFYVQFFWTQNHNKLNILQRCSDKREVCKRMYMDGDCIDYI